MLTTNASRRGFALAFPTSGSGQVFGATAVNDAWL